MGFGCMIDLNTDKIGTKTKKGVISEISNFKLID
jgi:hypothetical protein